MTTEHPINVEPWSPLPWLVNHAPTTEYEALMGASPVDEPDLPTLARLLLREAVADCIDMLSDEDRFIIEAIWFEGISTRTLAVRMGVGKSHGDRISRRAVQRLGQLCAGHPVLSAKYDVA